MTSTTEEARTLGVLADWAAQESRDLAALSKAIGNTQRPWPQPNSVAKYALLMQHITELITAIAAPAEAEAPQAQVRQEQATCRLLSQAGTSMAWGLRNIAVLAPANGPAIKTGAVRLRTIAAEAVRTAADRVGEAAAALRAQQESAARE